MFRREREGHHRQRREDGDEDADDHQLRCEFRTLRNGSRDLRGVEIEQHRRGYFTEEHHAGEVFASKGITQFLRPSPAPSTRAADRDAHGDEGPVAGRLAKDLIAAVRSDSHRHQPDGGQIEHGQCRVRKDRLPVIPMPQLRHRRSDPELWAREVEVRKVSREPGAGVVPEDLIVSDDRDSNEEDQAQRHRKSVQSIGVTSEAKPRGRCHCAAGAGDCSKRASESDRPECEHQASDGKRGCDRAQDDDHPVARKHGQVIPGK